MKFFAFLRVVMLVVAGLVAADWRTEAQILGFGLSVTSSVSSVAVGNPVTYTLILTNFSGQNLGEVFVTNTLPSSVQFVSDTNDLGVVTNYASTVVFAFPSFVDGVIAPMAFTVIPTAAGLITNTIFVNLPNLAVTNVIATNVVVVVTNVVTEADLGVTMTGPTQPAITNDWITYGMTVSNAGPSAAPGVLLTNIVPVSLTVEGIVPTNSAGILLTNNSLVYGVVFNLGTIPSGGSTNVQVTVEIPEAVTNAPFFASVGSTAVTDLNTNNNVAITNLTVMDYLPGLLLAVTNSLQTTNFQNGLGEQSVFLINESKTIVPAERVVVTGLPKELFNAVGTNGGNPFVTIDSPLLVGQSVSLLLQYFPRGAFPFTNGQLQAYAVPVPNLTPPKVTGTSTSINIDGIFQLPNGNMLVEFPATPGQSYTVVYSDNVQFSNAMIAPPAITAPANYVQWIDYGPPTTVSAATNSSARFYRVLKNP
jgi:uncharacterized repeat protein (TIGR01451 family)